MYMEEYISIYPTSRQLNNNALKLNLVNYVHYHIEVESWNQMYKWCNGLVMVAVAIDILQEFTETGVLYTFLNCTSSFFFCLFSKAN